MSNSRRALTDRPCPDPFLPLACAARVPARQMRIGRQTNAKSVPGERNGYFDSKVLSRTHAEVWQENGKVRSRAPRGRPPSRGCRD